MKVLRILLLLVFGISLFSSCSKSHDPVSVPVSDLSGKYEGKFGTGTNSPSSFFGFNIKQNGTLEEISSSGEVIGTGTWTITGNNFTGSYHYIFPATSFFKVAGTYDASSKKISGTWGYGSSDKDGGKWFMTKQ